MPLTKESLETGPLLKRHPSSVAPLPPTPLLLCFSFVFACCPNKTLLYSDRPIILRFLVYWPFVMRWSCIIKTLWILQRHKRWEKTRNQMSATETVLVILNMIGNWLRDVSACFLTYRQSFVVRVCFPGKNGRIISNFSWIIVRRRKNYVNSSILFSF